MVNPVKSALPLVNIVTPVPTLTVSENVVTPAILTLSKLVWPSTSKSPLISAPVATTVPVTVTPIPEVCNLFVPV